MKMSNKNRAALAATAAVAFLAAPQVRAAALSWDPGIPTGTNQNPATPTGGTGSWDLSTANWSNATSDIAWSDTTGTADTATFGGTAGTVTLGANLGALGLIFNTAGYAVDTNGNTLAVGASGITANNTTGTQAISGTGGITLGAAQTWTNNSSDSLTLGSLVTGSSNVLTLNGTGAFAFTGGFTGLGSGSIFSSGTTENITGSSTLSGALFVRGNTTVSAGTFAGSNQYIVVSQTGAFTVSGGSLTGGNFRVGDTAGDAASLTVSGSGQIVGSKQLEFSHAGGTVASSLNLDGGSFSTGFGFKMTGLGIVNFNGGTLKFSNNVTDLSTSNPTRLTLSIKAGGAVVDTGNFGVGFSSALVHDASATTGDGGLTKLGTGTLTLSGAGTYNGNTSVNAGTLIDANTSAVGTGNVFVSPNSSAGAIFQMNDPADLTALQSLTLTDYPGYTTNLALADLNYSGTDTIASLMDNGTMYTQAGTYGATGSGAMHEVSFLTGGGFLQVSNVAAPEPSGMMLLERRRRRLA